MRMWNVPVEILCIKHLIAEHVEMHMYLGSIKKGISLKGYIKKGLVEVHNIKNRHDELVEEMLNRGYNHKSELNVENYLWDEGLVDSEQNINELKNRCKYCRERIENGRK